MLKGASAIITSANRVPYWATYVLLSALVFVASLYIPDDKTIPDPSEVADRAKATIDVILEMVQLLTALNTALLGAAGAIAAKGKEWSPNWSKFDGTAVVLILVCVSVSYYGIYLGYSSMLAMVAKGALSPFARRMSWAFDLQYYGMLSAAFLLGLIFSRMLEPHCRQAQVRQRTE